jgi:uncharacterized tellurite resistance protein B-like protein
MSISKLLPAGPVSDAAHADALLEIAFLMTQADGKLEEAELVAFREIAARVYGRATNEIDPTEIVQRFTVSVDGNEIKERVREIAPKLPAGLRESAFKLAIGLALVDDDASPMEDELVGVLFEALGLDGARAEAIASECRAAFQAP